MTTSRMDADAEEAEMDCQSCQDELIDYVYDELPDARRRAVSRHLGRCSSCALEFCQQREELDGLTRAFAEAPGEHVRAALRAEVERSFGPPLWRRLLRAWTRPVPAYGVAVAGLLPVLLWVVTASLSATGGGSSRAVADAGGERGAALIEARASSSSARIADYDASTVLGRAPGLW